jgi:hypothetical protein
MKSEKRKTGKQKLPIRAAVITPGNAAPSPGKRKSMFSSFDQPKIYNSNDLDKGFAKHFLPF